MEVLLEHEDAVLEAAAQVLRGGELGAERAVGHGEAEGGLDGAAHILLRAAGERGPGGWGWGTGTGRRGGVLAVSRRTASASSTT